MAKAKTKKKQEKIDNAEIKLTIEDLDDLDGLLVAAENGKTTKKKKTNTTKQEPLEKLLWKAADKLRKNIDAVKVNTKAPIRKTRTNTRPRISSSCRPRRVGLT